MTTAATPDNALREAFRKIANQRRRRGHLQGAPFLKWFAQAFISADAANAEILVPAALQLALKYGLFDEPYGGQI